MKISPWTPKKFFVFLCPRDLSVDAGLPPHQYHIHPLPQHYQHYLTSPRMHHFPRNNASTQVVSRNHVRIDSSSGYAASLRDRRRPSSSLRPSSRLFTRSGTIRTLSCTCWRCRVSTLRGTRLPSGRVMRWVLD